MLYVPSTCLTTDGYSIEELCPITGTVRPEIRGKAKHLLRGSIFGSSTQKVPANRYVNGGYAIAMEVPTPVATIASPTATDSSTDDAQNSDSSSASSSSSSASSSTSPENCMWPNALQVSLKQSSLSSLKQAFLFFVFRFVDLFRKRCELCQINVTMEIKQVLAMIIEFGSECSKIIDTFKWVD